MLVEASPGWLVLAVAARGALLRLLRGHVRPDLLRGPGLAPEPGRSAGSELAMGSLVPASGAGGLALGAWVLHRGGMDGDRIARRSVAFFLIKSGVNFVAVALIGTALAVGLLGPDLSLWLTAFPRVAGHARDRGGGVAAAPGARSSPFSRPRRPPKRALVQRDPARGGPRHRGGRGRSCVPPITRRSRRLFRLLVLRQRGALGDLPRLRSVAADHGDPDGLPDRTARRLAADAGRRSAGSTSA